MRLEGKVAVITGGASGMGLATVERFLTEGASVVIADFNQETGEAALATAIDNGYGDSVAFIKTDVAAEADIVAMFELATARFGRLDIVFNNAGVGGAIGPLTETTVADWDYTFDVLAKGVFLGIKHGARIMQAQGEGGYVRPAELAPADRAVLPSLPAAAELPHQGGHGLLHVVVDRYFFPHAGRVEPCRKRVGDPCHRRWGRFAGAQA